MNWHYAVGGQQQGPIDDAQLDALIQAGTVTQDTLVWREGMASWQPLRQARPSGAGSSSAPAAPPVAAPPVAGGTSGPGEVVCAECGKLFTRDNAIQYGSAWVCATCKPVFLQKLREGAAPGGAPIGQPGAPFDPDAFLAAIRERDYNIDIGSCVGRGWELVKANFWPSIGVVVVVYACLFVGSFIPCVGGIIQLVIQGPLMGGMYWFFLKLIRRQEAVVGDAFAGFSIGFLQLFLVGLVTGILIALCVIPAAVVIGVGAATTNSDVAPFLIALAVLITAVPVVYLSICWLYSIPLVIDKRIDFWPAMELSRKVVNMHWGKVFLLAVVCGLISLAGILALCVGFLVALPVVVAALMYAYEDIFSGGSPAQG
jgi:uncharacterized membrane protein